jgi:hypothetical protein
MRFSGCLRIISGLCLLATFVAGAPSTHAQQQRPEDVIAAEIRAQDEHRWETLPDHWVTREQATLRTFFATNDDRAALRGYFAIERARLVGLKELAGNDGAPFVDIAPYEEQYQAVKLFYVAIAYRVMREDKYHYNGTNYRLMILVREQHVWRLAQMSEAPVEALVAAGKGFGTSGEAAAMHVRTARSAGIIINAEGQHLGTNAADPDEERRRRGHQPVPPNAAPVTEATPVPPSIIYVRMTKSANKVWYGCPTECTIGVTFTTTYLNNVLPNEWSDPHFPVESLRTGAMAVKHFGWYLVLNPKYPGLGFDAYDDTRDQTYIAGTAKTWSTAAVDAVAGIGMYREYSRDIFQAQYIKGTCICDGGQRGGKVLQLGSWYQARDQGKNYFQILRYYYDYASLNLAGQPIGFFYY